MTYGMIAAESFLLTDITDKLHENTKKVNTVERLGRHLAKVIPSYILTSYLNETKRMAPDTPVVCIDDSDLTKPEGRKFEAIGMVLPVLLQNDLLERISRYRSYDSDN